MANPTLLKTPIASGGDKNTIPETTGSTTGLLSQEKGWQQINSLPINAGGIAPSRLDFNGVFNLLSNILFYAQKGWVWEFDETQNYFAGCTVKDTADGKTYVCIADVPASTTHPSSDTTHWKLSDLATKDDLANYLPLAGGAMSGNRVYRNVDNDYINYAGGSSADNGASISLSGKSRSGDEGTFYVIAKDSANTTFLLGKPDGTLKWAGANVLTDAQGGYLLLSGGAMTGNTISRNIDTAKLALKGGSTGGATLEIYGKNFSDDATLKGAFAFYTNDGTNSTILKGLPNGTLTWGSNDLAGASIVAKAISTTGYIKYANGLIIQWGRVDTVGTATELISFPISFSSNLFSIVLNREYTAGQTETGASNFVRRNNLSSFYIRANEADIHPMDWIAIGM